MIIAKAYWVELPYGGVLWYVDCPSCSGTYYMFLPTMKVICCVNCHTEFICGGC